MAISSGVSNGPPAGNLSVPVDSNPAANTVAEGAAAGSTVGVTVSAVDPSGPAPTYSLLGDSTGGGAFAIDPNTGVVTIANPSKIDFESSPGHALKFVVLADNGSARTTQQFTVAVTDVAPSTPTDSDATPNNVNEGAVIGSPVGIRAVSTDVNGPGVTWSLIGDSSHGGFDINSSTGEVVVVDSTKIDYETSPGHAYTITAQASDGTLTSSQTFTINVNDINLTVPADADPAANTVTEGAAAGSTVGVTVSAFDRNGPAVTYSLLGDSSGGGFAINSATGVVTVADPSKIDFESSPGHVYKIVVLADNGERTTQQFTIGVTDVDLSVPVDSNAAANTVAEGAAVGTTVGVTVSAVDPNGPAVTYSLLGDSTGGGAFAINSSTGVVTIADPSKIDFESSPGHTMKFVVLADSGTNKTTQQFTIGVTDVAPSAPIDNNGAVNTVFELAATGTAVGITAFSADPGGGPAATYSLTDNAGGRFAIDANTGIVTVANGTAIDFETAPGHAYGITVRATSGALSSTQNFSIAVANVNEAPQGTNNTITTPEDTPYVFSIADFGFSDPLDSSAPNALLAVKITSLAASLTNNGNPVNVGDFISAVDIAAGHLVFTPASNFSGFPEPTFSFRVQDNGGTANGGIDLAQTPNSMLIEVTPVNDAPVVTAGHTLNYAENQAATAIDTAITVSDVDSANLASATVQITGNYVNGEDVLGFTTQNGITGSFNAATGTLTLTGSSSVANYQAALRTVTYVNTSDNPSGAARTVTIVANDGAANSVAKFDTITVTPANDAPVVTAGHILNYSENQIAAPIDPAIAVSDVDSPNLASATVQITGNYISGEDILGFSNQNGITGTFDSLTGTLTLTGSSSVANYQTALASVTYFNTSDTPSAAARTVTIITNDGAANSVAVTDTINVTPVNDAPVVTAGHTLNYTENQAATAIDTALAVSDVDSANLVSATVQITGNYVNGEDVLAFATIGAISGSFDALTGTLTLTGSDTVANYEAALRTVTYQNTSDNPSGAARTVTIIANDGTASSVAATDTINVTPVNDAPVVIAGHVLNYTENQAATAIDPAIAVSDVDSPNLASATVQITGNYVNGEDVLAFSDTATITGSFDALTGTLTLTGSDTVANYQAALASVTYVNTSDNPSGAARTVTIITNDGAASSVAATDTINVTPVNDAPVVAAGNTLNYTENDPATAIDTALAVSDADSANLVSATVQITGGYVNGEDVLAFATIGAISGSFDALTGTLTLTGSDTVANYQAALRTVTYQNTSENPSGAARTVTIMANDGAASSVAATDTINVTPVNDAPVVVAGHTLNYAANQPATAIDPAILASDVDSANLVSATVQITGNYVNGEDVLGFSDTATITGSFDALTGTLTLTGSDSVANYQAALASVTYVNTSPTPSGASRTVTIIANDGTASSVAATDTISFDTAPTVTASHTLNYTENQAATAFDPAIAVSDVDSPNLVSATVQITGNYVNGEDVLAFATIGAISGSFDPLTGTLTLTGSDTVAHYQAALRTVTYVNTSENPSGAARTVTIITNDGILNSTPATDTINVTPVNDAPVVVAGHTLNYTENQAATAIDTALAVSDVDSANLASATVQITGNYVNGEDVLAFATIGAISGSFDALTGKLTLTGSDTVANYQAALRTVTYQNTSDNPSGAARTVTIIANDGTANSVAVTDTINVTPVNDAPVVTAGHTLNYTENQAATAIDTALAVSDADSANLASATVQITGGYVNGEDVLAFATIGAISGTFDAPSGTLTLTGSDTVAHYQAALRTVTYHNTSDNPSGAARTVTIIANDGAASSVAATDTINVTPVNDAPVVTFGTINGFTEPANGTPAANSVPVTIAPNLAVSDVDSANLTQATFVLNNLKPSDALSVSGHAGASGDIGGIHFAITSTAGTETVTFTGTDTIANYNAALDLVQFNNTSENPDTTARSYTVTAVDDGTGTNTGSASTTETVTAVNDAPVNTVPTEQDTIFTDTDTPLTGLFSVTDVDGGSGVTTQLHVAHGILTVATGVPGGVTTITNNGSATVTLTGTPGQITTTLQATNGVVYHGTATFTGVDTLTVTTNDNGQTGTGAHPDVVSSENLGVIPKVWFIDNNTGNAGSGTGTQTDPFTSIAAFNAASTGHTTSEYVYLKTGTGTYSEADGIHLQDGQTLIGQGDGLSFPDPLHAGNLTIETAGTTPKIVVPAGKIGIDLASNNTIHGLNVDTSTNGSAVAIDDGPSATSVGNLTISNLDILGAGKAIDIDHGGGTLNVTIDSLTSSGSTTQGVNLGGAMSGTFNISAGSISGSTGVAFNVNGGTASIDDNGTIAKTSSGQAISLVNHTGGTVKFDGSVSSTSSSTGINLTGNTGATMTFDGGVNVSTSSGTGLNATGGGTLIVTGTTANNHLTTNTGTAALNVNGVTIGTGGLNFHDIFANGSTNGIVLNNTGSTAGLTVTGNGSAVTDGSNSSGGSILNSTGAGISLTSTQAPSFTNMLIQNSAGDGIDGTSVHGFTFANGKIDNSGTGLATNASNIGFDNISSGVNNIDGAVSVTGSVLSNAYYHGLDIYNESGTISNLVFTGNTLTSSTSTASSKGSGVHIDENGNAGGAGAITKANVSSNTINNFPSGAAIQIQGGNAALGPQSILGDPTNSINVITINSNVIGGASGVATGTNGIMTGMTGTGKGHFAITNNQVSHFLGIGIVNFGGNQAVDKVLVDSNTVNAADNIAGSSGISVGTQLGVGQTGTITATITSNTVTHADGNGILAGVTNSNNTGYFIIKNNNIGVSDGTDEAGIRVLSGSSSGDTTLFLDMTGNTTAGSGDSPGIAVRKQGTVAGVNEFNIIGLSPSPANPNQTEDFLAGANPNSTLGAAGFSNDGVRATKVIVVNGDNFQAGTFPAGTFTPPLNAAPGGVQASSPTAGETHLTEAQLGSVVAAAIAQWAHAGASAAQLAALAAVTFSVADLAGKVVGEQSPGHITIDVDAAGHGWFVDPTPNDNSEFTHAQNAAGTDLYTDASNVAAGHLDLLTTVTHELGHVLGVDDSLSPNDVHDLMYIDLVDGERRVPDAADVARASEADIPQISQAPAGTPIVAGNAANNSIDAGHGGNLLFGGAGADTFVFGPSIQLNAPAPAQITHVADYSAAQGDTFDFSALTSAFHNSSVSDSLVVRAVEDASGKFATLQVDHIDPIGLPSAPNWVNVAQLDGAHAGDTVNILIDNHSVHLAQIHVDLLV
jgi:hypothetical protein